LIEGMDDILEEFLSESLENLEKVDNELMGLEKNPNPKQILASIFRSVHSIKGTCGFFGLRKLESVAHVGETLLARLRDGDLSIDSDNTRALFKLVDAVRDMLNNIALDKQEGFTDYSELIATLSNLAQGEQLVVDDSDTSEAGPVTKSTPPAEATSKLESRIPEGMEEALSEFLSESYENLEQVDEELLLLEHEPADPEIIASLFRTVHTIKGTSGFFDFGRLETLAHAGEALLSKLRKDELPLENIHIDALFQMVDAFRSILDSVQENRTEGSGDNSELVELLSNLRTSHDEMQHNPLQAADAQTHDTSSEKEKTAPRTSESTVRVNVGTLDILMNLVGELVLTRNQLLEQYKHTLSNDDMSAQQRLNELTRELQDIVMKTRMQTLNTIWRKLPRIVRDLAQSLGKEVELEMVGGETELDRTILSAINDPLTHLVRNAIDHGLELPEERRACGKSATGKLTLSAYYEGDLINIEVRDDGAGINVKDTKKKAVDSGLITQAQADSMGIRTAMNLVFSPGFSTAKQVTNVSGRGVGMDVVLTNIEKLGGSVELDSEKGKGTLFHIKLPLTLAIVPALVLTSNGQRYAVPQVNVVEVTKPGLSGQCSSIEMVHGIPNIRLRDDLFPLLYLEQIFNKTTSSNDKFYKQAAGNGKVILLRAGDRRYGLVVDDIIDNLEIVVRPLVSHLKGGTTFSGATVLGDGTVALILDVVGLADQCKVPNRKSNRAGTHMAEGTKNAANHGKNQQLLLCQNPQGGRMALLLEQVVRLEELKSDVFDRVHGQMVIQSAGAVLPVIDFAKWINTKSPLALQELSFDIADQDLPQLVVCESKGSQIGLVVSQIIGIVDSNAALSPNEGAGRVRCVVIDDQISELVHLDELINECRPLLLDRIDSTVE